MKYFAILILLFLVAATCALLFFFGNGSGKGVPQEDGLTDSAPLIQSDDSGVDLSALGQNVHSNLALDHVILDLDAGDLSITISNHGDVDLRVSENDVALFLPNSIRVYVSGEWHTLGNVASSSESISPLGFEMNFRNTIPGGGQMTFESWININNDILLDLRSRRGEDIICTGRVEVDCRAAPPQGRSIQLIDNAAHLTLR